MSIQQLHEAFESAVAQYTDRKYVVPAWQASPFGFEMFCLGVKYAEAAREQPIGAH